VVNCGEVDVGDGDKNSTLVGASNLLVKCHGEPENHKSHNDPSKTSLNIWEIDITSMRKKMGRIGLLLIPQCEKYEFHHSECSYCQLLPQPEIEEKAE
jgi:hypothetical protein